jgi:hypothetical protein
MKFGQISCAALIFVLPLGMQVASASECTVSGPRYWLTSDTVDWSMKIGSGQSCIRGLRFYNVAIESAKLVSPPQAGQVTLLGPSFTYSAKSDYEGEDFFTLAVSGTISRSRSRGSSTIRVMVSVGNPAPAAAIRTVPPPPPQALTTSPADKTPLPVNDGSLPRCPAWDWSKGAPPPMHPPFDRSKLYCPPPPFKPPSPPIGCSCP